MIPWSENLQLDPRQVSGTQPCKSWPWSFETERSPWQGMTTGMENATWKLGAPIAGWVKPPRPHFNHHLVPHMGMSKDGHDKETMERMRKQGF